MNNVICWMKTIRAQGSVKMGQNLFIRNIIHLALGIILVINLLTYDNTTLSVTLAILIIFNAVDMIQTVNKMRKKKDDNTR